jgi:hypothetical protein
MKIFETMKRQIGMIFYNLKIIFGNKFIYFLLGAVGLFLLITILNLAQGQVLSPSSVYEILILVGALLLFYPIAFGIQSDKDARTLEIIFGIPDYRFRVWFMRVLLIYTITFLFVLLLGFLLKISLTNFPLFKMGMSVMFPLFFMGFLAFFLSTVTRSGNGTAAIVIIISLILMMFSGAIRNSQWNVFFNPWGNTSGTNALVWANITIKNRIFLMAGAALFMLAALLNLQKREKFLG